MEATRVRVSGWSRCAQAIVRRRRRFHHRRTRSDQTKEGHAAAKDMVTVEGHDDTTVTKNDGHPGQLSPSRTDGRIFSMRKRRVGTLPSRGMGPVVKVWSGMIAALGEAAGDGDDGW